MKKLLGSSPKTTIIGIAKGLLIVLWPIFQKEGFDIKNDYPYVIGAVLLYLGGRFSKDSDGITPKEDVIVAKSATSGEIPPEK